METNRRIMYVQDMLKEVIDHNIKGGYTISFKIEDYYGEDLLSITDGDFTKNGLLIRIYYMKVDFRELIDAFKVLVDYTRREKS